MTDLQRKLLQKDLDQIDTAFITLEEIQELSFDEAKMLSEETFKIWVYLNNDSFKLILEELNRRG